SIYFKDYALNVMPDQPILAGQISIATSVSVINSLSAFEIQQEDYGITLKSPYDKGVVMYISDLSGKEIQKVSILSYSQFISTAELAGGIYLVHVEGHGKSLVKKIFMR